MKWKSLDGRGSQTNYIPWFFFPSGLGSSLFLAPPSYAAGHLFMFDADFFVANQRNLQKY